MTDISNAPPKGGSEPAPSPHGIPAPVYHQTEPGAVTDHRLESRLWHLPYLIPAARLDEQDTDAFEWLQHMAKKHSVDMPKFRAAFAFALAHHS